MPLGGFLGGLANLGTINAGVNQGAESGSDALLRMLALRQAQQQTQAQELMPRLLEAYVSGQQQQAPAAPPDASTAPPPMMAPPPGMGAPGPPTASAVPFSAVAPIIARQESGGRNIPSAVDYDSGGLWQEGNAFVQDYAPKAGVPIPPAPPPGQRSLALSLPPGDQYRVAEAGYNARGTQPWHAPGIPKLGPGGARPPLGGGGARMIPGLPPETGQQITSLAHGAAMSFDPTQWGRTQLPALVKALHDVAPDAPEGVKFAALQMASSLLAPDQRMAWEMFKMQNQDALRLTIADMTTRRQEEMEAGRERRFEESQVGIESRFDRAQAGMTERAAQTQEGQPFGSPYQREGKWYERTRSGDEVEIPGTPIGAVPKDAGRQLQQQQRMIGAANTAEFYLHNISRLPITASRGWFMGLETKTPEAMTDAIKRNIARASTAYETKEMQATAKGLGRVFGMLETQGGLQGMQTYGNMIEDALTPQEGDPPLLTMRRMADMRGILERALETGRTQTKDPKVLALLDKLDKSTKDSVPYTMDDVTDLEDQVRRHGSDPSKVISSGKADESIRAFSRKVMKNLGVSGDAGVKGDAPTATDDKGNKVMWDGKAWVPVGGGAGDRPGK